MIKLRQFVDNMIKLRELLEIQMKMDSWCLAPGKYIAYKVGSISNTDFGIFFSPTKQSAQSFMNPYNMTADKYQIQITNPIIAVDLKEAYSKMIRFADQQILDAINVNNIDSTRRSTIKKLFILSKALEHDAIVYTGESYDPTKRVLCLYNNKQILTTY